MADKKEVIGKVTVRNVRLSFESLYQMNRQTQDDGTVRETWKANFLFPKDLEGVTAKRKGVVMPILEALKAAKEEAMAKKWGDRKNWPKLKPEKLFLRDGDLENWDGYMGNWYISASAQPQDRPSVVTNRRDGNGKWIPATPGGEGAPYGGCYVNATIVIWCQDNEHGKRVNAQVKSVQFFRDGEAFGAAPVDPNEEFDDDDVGDAGEIGDYGDDDDDNVI